LLGMGQPCGRAGRSVAFARFAEWTSLSDSDHFVDK
jgi:hypothetical protein